jgi:Uncharacterised ArCR, COG2043
LKLRAIPFGMKLFERREEMEAIPRIRRPKAMHTLDHVVAQAAPLGRTIGIASEDLVGAQCRAVVGLGLSTAEKWRSGQHNADGLGARRHPKAIADMEALAKNGLRYPFLQYGIQEDVRAAMAVSYPGRGG